MGVGGFCASGGPYQIRVERPHGVEALMPISIVVGVVAALVFAASCPDWLTRWSILAWSGLFLVLAWNFLTLGLPSEGQPPVWTWLILGVAFVIMGLTPLVWPIKSGSVRKPGSTTGDHSASGRSPRRSAGSGPGNDEVRSTGVVAALERLSKLRAQGDLTDDEFRRAKDQLLKGGSYE